MTFHELKSMLGSRVRQYRLAQGMKQEAFAEAIERSVETVSNIERGKSAPSLETLQVIAKVLDVAMADLIAPPPVNGSERTAALHSRADSALKKLPEDQLHAAVQMLEAIQRANRP